MRIIILLLFLILSVVSLAYADVTFDEVRSAILKKSIHDSSQSLLDEFEGKVVNGSGYVVDVVKYPARHKVTVLISKEKSRNKLSASVSIDVPKTSLFHNRAKRLSRGERVFYSGKIDDIYRGKIFLKDYVRLN